MQAVLGLPADERAARVYRRLVADLGVDVYVAEEPGGEIVGVVSVIYARSLVRGGMSAVLDGARVCGAPARPLLEGLVAFAEDRARRRGCRRLAAWVEPEDGALREALAARGYRPGALMIAELAPRNAG